MSDGELKTARKVIDAIGGPSAAAALTQKSPQAVWNWTDRNKFPADTYLVLTDELNRLGKKAPPSLWGIKEPAGAAA